MKSKFFIILFLVGLFVFVVDRMMKYENAIREKRVVVSYVEDESKALIDKIDAGELEKLAFSIEPLARAGKTYFQVKKQDVESGEVYWEDVFLKGVNLGVALPGKFPAEFSMTFEQYLEWLNEIGQMNANVIRVYTILPPEFYKALSAYNYRHQEREIYVMQGVWAKVPSDEDYYNVDFTRDFQKEIIDVLDVIHGQAVLPEERGKAHGVYSVDVSQYIIGYLLGREWEPRSVFITNRKNYISHFNGSFITINHANAMEVWLAKMMDFTVLYETQTYQEQHPISFVNWLPLDPMYHSTEFIENKKVREYDNDLESIDFTKFNQTPLFHAGIYGAYHVYPYYPDFIYLKNKYAETVNELGEKDNFLGYLKDLKAHTEGMPLVIAEYGLPSSRGVSHFAHSGFNQGGHSEAEQAQKSLVLTKDIFDANLAGAIYFEWADEWFKHNWLVMDFEVPFHNRKLWHNMENPEQNFGILALEARTKTIDGDWSEWSEEAQRFQQQENKWVASSDATYFYLAAELPNFDFKKNNLYIAIDTYDKEKGDHKLPFMDKVFDRGFEFLCVLKNEKDARILVDDSYAVFSDIYNDSIPVYASKQNENGLFVDELMLVNRGRESLIGTKTDSIIRNRGLLSHGFSGRPETSNADWNWSSENHQLEMRLDWHLLNVSDPSHRYVLDDVPKTKDIEASQTDAFNIYFFLTDIDNQVLAQMPESKPFRYELGEWETPSFSARKKPIYDSLQHYFYQLAPPDIEEEAFSGKEKFVITNFLDDKNGAVSISFEGVSFSQYQYAFPELNKYKLKATFGIDPEKMMDLSSKIQRGGSEEDIMGYQQIKELLAKKNDVAIEWNRTNDPVDLYVKELGRKIEIVHPTKGVVLKNNADEILFSRVTSGTASFGNVGYTVYNERITEKNLESLLKANEQKWSIYTYTNIFRDSLEIQRVNSDAADQYILFDDLKKQIRLIRNTGYWVDTEANIYKYLKEKRHAAVDVKNYGEKYFVTIQSGLNPSVFNVPLTLKYITDEEMIKVTGSAADGYYVNRKGYFLLSVFPNKEIEIKKISDEEADD